MIVSVDLNLCESHGECVFLAPDVFEFGEDGVLQFREQPDESRREACEEAAAACPVQAITVA